MKSALPWLLALAFFAMGIASARDAHAAPRPSNRLTEELFEKLDSNRDKRLSEKEFIGEKRGGAKKSARGLFLSLDKDNNNSLTLKEFKKKQSRGE